MVIRYIQKAMNRTIYDKLEDGIFCGEIPDCPGTIAFGNRLSECQEGLWV